jgi:hypothetical protein
MAIVRYAGNKFTGLFADTKPTTVPDGATFYETDTTQVWVKVSGAWVNASSQMFNNFGQVHATQADANAPTNFGFHYLQGTTNGPGTGAGQFYSWSMGLGIDYPYAQYVCQVAFPRHTVTDANDQYVSYRLRESTTWGAWKKIKAGYADTAGSATSATSASNSTTSSAVAGTTTYIPRFSSATQLANSLMYTDNSTYMYISGGGALWASGDVVAYYSDERLKTIYGNIKGALEKVRSLNGFHYQSNEAAQALGYKAVPDVGLSAQEVQRVLPEAVVSAPINKDTDTDYLTIKYDRMIPLLVESIKELSAQVDSLKLEVEELKRAKQ